MIMSYLKQVTTVTRWEFSRFFKPKNEAIGIFVLLIVSAVIYIGSRYAFSDKSPEIEVFVHNDTNGALTEVLKNDFNVQQLPSEQKASFIRELGVDSKCVLIDKKKMR